MEIKKILFLCKKGTPPNKYKLHQLFKETEFFIPKMTVKLIKSFESFQVFEWEVALFKKPSSKQNLDYEGQAANLEFELAETFLLNKPKAVGRHSLLINNFTDSPVSIIIPRLEDNDLGEKEAFVLNIFLKYPYNKTIFRTVKIDEDYFKLPAAYLNPMHSVFQPKQDSIKWDMVFLLSPLGKGKSRLEEIIQTVETRSIVDGLQSYIIKPTN
jgi:hypothetical protein